MIVKVGAVNIFAMSKWTISYHSSTETELQETTIDHVTTSV